MDYREIVLRLAGPYELNNGWLVLKSAVPSDPTKKIREMADEIGYIDRQLATIELNKWGLDSSLHEEWLVRDGKIRKFNGRLVRWDGIDWRQVGHRSRRYWSSDYYRSPP